MTETPVRTNLIGDTVIAATDGFQGADRSMSRAKTDVKQPRFAVTPGKLWTAFLHRWKIALAVGLVLACFGAGMAWLTYKPKYTAMATMRMTASRPRLLPGGQGEEFGNFARGDFQKTQAQLVKSRSVLIKVLEDGEIGGLATIYKLESPQAWLEKELQADFIPGTDIFRIWLTSENPEDIKKIVNKVQSEYVHQFKTAAESVANSRAETIETVMLKAMEKIRVERGKLRVQAETYKTSDSKVLNLRQTQLLDRYGKIESELYVLEAGQRSSSALISVMMSKLKNIESEKPSPELIEEYLATQPSVQKEQHEIARVESQIKEYSKSVPAGNLRLGQMNDELKAAQSRLQKIKLDAQPDVLKRIQNASQRELAISLEQAQLKLKVQTEQYKVVSEKANELGREVDKLGLGGIDIENRRAEIEETEATLKQLRAAKDRIEIEKSNKHEPVEAIQPAEVPTVNQASLFKTTGLYTLAGLMFGLLAVSFFEARLHRVHHSTDVVQDLGIPALGILPLLEKGSADGYGRTLPSDHSWSGIMFADAVNSLCTRLLCDDRLTRNAVIMVTSASEDEGKTMLATQLAAGFAHSGRKTLLLDCDFRKPACHQQLGLSAGPGLSEVLGGGVQLENALQSIPNCEAKFMTAGQTSPHVIKALNNGDFAALLQRLRKDFDCIIIDSAPTLLVSDGLLLGKMADGVLMVVRSKVSKGPAIYSAFEQLLALKIPMLGAVINATPGRTWSRYHLR